MDKPLTKRSEILKQIEDAGLDELPGIFDALLDVARGAKVLVLMEDTKPRGARKVGDGRLPQKSEGLCPTCGRLRDSLKRSEIVEVWQLPPDTALLRYLHEHLAGKAKSKAEQQIDPVINIYFGPIETVWTPDTVQGELEQESLSNPSLLGMS